jgi:hypothetical protein
MKRKASPEEEVEVMPSDLQDLEGDKVSEEEEEKELPDSAGSESTKKKKKKKRKKKKKKKQSHMPSGVCSQVGATPLSDDETTVSSHAPPCC